MTQANDELDVLVETFWKNGATNENLAAQIRSRALSHPPKTGLSAGRCLPIMDLIPAPGSWKDRMASFHEDTVRRVRRFHQIDQLGDLDTEPEALFEILADDVNDLDVETFDAQALRRARIGKPIRALAAEAFLDTLGWDSLPQHVANDLRAAIRELEGRSERFRATALFASTTCAGLALGVNVASKAGKEVTIYNDADDEMKRQATAVLQTAYGDVGAGWSIEWEVPFGGNSIGLALWVAAMVDQGAIDPDPLLAATGRLDASGNVLQVGEIDTKVRAAISCGFRRIAVPVDNEAEARAAAEGSDDITIVGVRNVQDLPLQLKGVSGAISIGFHGCIRYIRKLIPLYGLDLIDEHEIKNGYRLDVADAASKAQIDVFRGRRGTVKAGGRGSAVQAATKLADERLPASRIERRDAESVLVAAANRRENLTTALERSGAQRLETTNPHESWRYRLEEGQSQATVVAYTSGKVVVPSGTAPAHDTIMTLVRKAVEGLGGSPATKVTEHAAQPPDDGTAHIGTDEAGKGDYFGPLVCAACYLDPEVSEVLRSLGVRDSKKLSDSTISRLAHDIRSRLPGRFSVVTIQPKRYNELTEELRSEGKNLNSLVAWGHSRGIKDLIVEHGIDAEYAVIDKFADEHYMHERLSADSRTRGLRLDLRIKAESDIAVAAASILARDAFVTWLDDESKKLGMPLPKGAGNPVIEAARRIVAARGADALGDVAKLSFKTTKKVLDVSQ